MHAQGLHFIASRPIMGLISHKDTRNPNQGRVGSLMPPVTDQGVKRSARGRLVKSCSLSAHFVKA